MRLLKIIVLGLLLTACATSGSQNTPNTSGDCAVTVSEAISILTTWQNSSATCDYFVQGDERGQLKINAALTIDAGTVVQFEKDVRVLVGDGGSIIAVGTPEARIRLEGSSQAQGYWQGICFNDNRVSRFEYIDILWDGRDEAGSSGIRLGGCNAAQDLRSK
jgi:hypothetical protein